MPFGVLLFPSFQMRRLKFFVFSLQTSFGQFVAYWHGGSHSAALRGVLPQKLLWKIPREFLSLHDRRPVLELASVTLPFNCPHIQDTRNCGIRANGDFGVKKLVCCISIGPSTRVVRSSPVHLWCIVGFPGRASVFVRHVVGKGLGAGQCWGPGYSAHGSTEGNSKDWRWINDLMRITWKSWERVLQVACVVSAILLLYLVVCWSGLCMARRDVSSI